MHRLAFFVTILHSATPVSPPALHNERALRSWLRQHGGAVGDHLHIAGTAPDRGVFAAARLQRGHELARLPLNAALSMLRLLRPTEVNAGLYDAIINGGRSRKSSACPMDRQTVALAAFVLVELARGNESPVAPWLASLPRLPPGPHGTSDALGRVLSRGILSRAAVAEQVLGDKDRDDGGRFGTATYVARELRRRREDALAQCRRYVTAPDVLARWPALRLALTKLRRTMRPPVATASVVVNDEDAHDAAATMNEEICLRAVSTVLSRAFDLDYGQAKLRLVVPFADMFNHHPTKGNHSLHVSDSDGMLRVVTHREHAAGTQVHINYGVLSNAALFVQYGFSLGKDNRADAVRVPLSVLRDVGRTHAACRGPEAEAWGSRVARLAPLSRALASVAPPPAHEVLELATDNVSRMDITARGLPPSSMLLVRLVLANRTEFIRAERRLLKAATARNDDAGLRIMSAMARPLSARNDMACLMCLSHLIDALLRRNKKDKMTAKADETGLDADAGGCLMLDLDERRRDGEAAAAGAAAAAAGRCHRSGAEVTRMFAAALRKIRRHHSRVLKDYRRILRRVMRQAHKAGFGMLYESYIL